MDGIGRALAPIVAFTSLAGIMYGASVLYNNQDKVERFSEQAYHDACHGSSKLIRQGGELVDKGRQELSERLKRIEQELKEGQNNEAGK